MITYPTIGALLSLLSFVPLTLWAISLKKRTSIKWLIERGQICPICHDENEDVDDWNRQEVTCKKCKRDQALNDVLNTKTKLLKKLNIVHSKNWQKWFLIIIITSVLIQTLTFVGFKPATVIGGALSLLAQTLNYLNFLHFSKKKKPNQ